MPTHAVDGHSPQPANGSDISPLAWSLCGVLIISVAVILRLYALDLKPLHHDEGVNGLFMTRLVRPPYTYHYDPAEYHGPTLYYLTKPVVVAFGLTTFSIRLVTAVGGIAIVLLAFSLRRRIGSIGALVAAALLAVSPGAVYFARYFIHETLLVCFTLGAVLTGWEYVQRRRPIDLLLASAFIALMFATKETAIVTVGVLAIAAVSVRIWEAWFRRDRPHPELPSPPLTTRRRVQLGIACLAVFVAINIVFYSSLFTQWGGVIDAVRSLAIWTRTGTRLHVQPWHTYLGWLAQEEAPLLVFGLLGSVLAFVHGRNRFAMFSALWSVGILSAYSLIPYKTPWLTLNVVVPLAVVAGWTADTMYVRLTRGWRRAAFALAGLCVLLSAYQSVVLNFMHYDDDRYPYVYAHTRRATLDLVNRIDNIQSHSTKPLTIAVAAPEYFPLTWYLRDYGAGYYGSVPTTNDPVFIGSIQQDDELHKRLGDRFVRSGPFSLRPGVDLVLYVRRDLALPE